MTVPDFIRIKRLIKRMSQEALAEAIGVKKNTITRIELGEQPVKFDQACKIAKVLEFSVTEYEKCENLK